MKITKWHIMLWTLYAFVLAIFWVPVILFPECQTLTWVLKAVLGTIIFSWMVRKE